MTATGKKEARRMAERITVQIADPIYDSMFESLRVITMAKIEDIITRILIDEMSTIEGHKADEIKTLKGSCKRMNKALQEISRETQQGSKIHRLAVAAAGFGELYEARSVEVFSEVWT